MPIPKTRAELVDLVAGEFQKLQAELDAAGPSVGRLPATDEGWSVKDLLAVRVWWTENVCAWVAAGMEGGHPETPAPGYGWKETPRLNEDTVRQSKRASFRSLRERLTAGQARVLALIQALDDAELLEPGAFAWAGRYPIARWISLNTSRQYTTARTILRRALRNAKTT